MANTATEQIILAIDTSDEDDAERLVAIAGEAGAHLVKMGLELATATSWKACSELAARHGLGWVADAKLDDIPNTVAGAVRNLVRLEHAPLGITMHTTAGVEAMRIAQDVAGQIKMLGVTVLTSISPTEGERLYHIPVGQQVSELARLASEAGLAGVVASPLEVGPIKRDPTTGGLFTMIPGIRSSLGDDYDQARVGTPAAAIRDGADLLVIGRQITQAADPAEAFQAVTREIEQTRS